MHPAPPFRWTDEAEMLALIDAAAFARIFLTTTKGPRVAHAPVLLTGPCRLRFHLANGNALVSELDGARVLTLSEGPNAYVSANWYVDQRGAVPTWNYLAVECEGLVRRLDRTELTDLVDRLADQLEPRVGADWTRAKMEPARFEAMLGAITGFELQIEDLRGTRKISQNKSDPEVAGVIAGMRANRAEEMADLIAASRP